MIRRAREHCADPSMANVPISHAYFTNETVDQFFDMGIVLNQNSLIYEIVLRHPEVKEQIRAKFMPKKYIKRVLVPRYEMRSVRRLTPKSDALVHPVEKKVWLTTNAKYMKLNEEETKRLTQIMQQADGGKASKTSRYISSSGILRLTCDLFETKVSLYSKYRNDL